MFLTKDLANNLYTPNQTNKRTKENSSSGGSVCVVSKIAQLNKNMEGYDHNGSLYAPFLSLKSHSKPELHQGEEEGSKARSEGCSRSIESKKKGKKQRFAFQTRSQVDILDDGYRWRKYGQKAVKNNKFPRSYYRCTYGGCNVKKQVQRLTVDQEVVVTTYEGVHSHPIEKSTENFEHILTQMQIYSSF